jgi:hypothetical protein
MEGENHPTVNDAIEEARRLREESLAVRCGLGAVVDRLIAERGRRRSRPTRVILERSDLRR